MSEQLEFLKSAAECTSPQFSDTPRPATRNIHSNEDKIIKLMDFEKKLQEQFDKLKEISDTINTVSDPTHQAILVKRYLSNKSWEDIASELYISVRHVQRLHGYALLEIERILKVGTGCHALAHNGTVGHLE